MATKHGPSTTGPGAAPLDACASAGDVLVAYLREQAYELRRHDPLVRRDRPDAVHQMRVAARRMRSVLQAFGRVLDRAASADLLGELTWLGGELAPARDTEVLAEHLVEQLDHVPDDLVLGPVRAEVVRTFARRQAEARQQALLALDSDRYLALHDGIDALLANPPFTARAGRAARRELPRGVARAFERFEERMARVGGATSDPDRDAALHDARKAAKRLRYAAEAVTPTSGAAAKRLQRGLGAVQDLLGTYQDSVVARAALRDLAAAAHQEGGNGFTYGLLHAADARRAEQAFADLPDTWRRMRRPRNLGWLQ